MKEKRLLLTMSIGEAYDDMKNVSEPLFKAYAERVGADYFCISENIYAKTFVHWNKLQYIYDLLNKYNRVLWLDSDILIRDDLEDMFEMVPDGQLAMFNEAAYTDRNWCIYDVCKEYGKTIDDWDGRYFNSGVMVIPRCCKHIFKKPELEFNHYFEQSYLNMRIAEEKPEIYQLTHYYNRMTCMEGHCAELRWSSKILHYAGASYTSGGVAELMKQDLEKWQEYKKNNYEIPLNILFSVQGGAGDQIDFIPTLRYAEEKIWPGANIKILTHFPRLFEGITNSPVYYHGEMQNDIDGKYREFVTLPGPDTPMWTYVSNLLCHTVDFCSMAVLRRTLPEKDKEIKLTVKPEDISEVIDVIGLDRPLEDYVLVHAGRHWQSKTLPESFWNGVIKGLADAGLPVVLIGKNDETRGTVNIDIPEGVKDTRDLLSLGGLIALISQAKVVVSNDSVPVHIAGAFDNYIILIPTCKSPSHILPWRHGSVWYKSAALYKELTLDSVGSAPTEIYGKSAEFLQEMVDLYPWLNDHQGGWEKSMKNTPEFNADLEKAWQKYIPEVADVVKKTLSFYNDEEKEKWKKWIENE